jgi:hypothetical protein
MSIFQKIINFFKAKDYASVWQEFAMKYNGVYSSIPADSVSFSYGEIPVTFDDCSNYTFSGPRSMQVNYLRGMASFVLTQPFQLLITEQGILENVSKIFGLQDIRIGDPVFDKMFMIQSNDETMALIILNNPELQGLLQEMKPVSLEITEGDGLFGEKPDRGKAMLYIILETSVTHHEQLQKFYRLFVNLIDTLIKHNGIRQV